MLLAVLLAGLPLTIDASADREAARVAYPTWLAMMKDARRLASLWDTATRARRLAKLEEDQVEESVSLNPGAAFDLDGTPWRLVYVSEGLPTGTETEAYLISPSDAVQVARWEGRYDGDVESTVVIDVRGHVTATRERRMEVPGLSDAGTLHSSSSARWQLLDGGRVAAEQPVFAANDGWYVDPKSREQLAIIGAQVHYRATAEQPWQTLAVDGDAGARAFAVRFARSKRPHSLTADPARGALVCRGPNGRVQTFGRVW